MEGKKHIVIVGATSGIARECAKIWVSTTPVCLSLVCRDSGKMERSVRDLHVRSMESKIIVYETDFLNPTSIQAIVNTISSQRRIDIALIAHGSLPNQSLCENDLEQNYKELLVNGVSPVLFAEAFTKCMLSEGHGVITLLGSVAGDKGRKSNYVYGSAKGLVTRYAQGLQHRLRDSNIKVVLVKPGPTDTPMTVHLKAEGADLTPVELVAEQIVGAIERGQAVLYTPRKWFLIMSVLQHLPRFIFNKLNI